MSGSFKNVVKIGCLGCFGLVVVIVIAAILLLWMAKSQVGEEAIESREISYGAQSEPIAAQAPEPVSQASAQSAEPARRPSRVVLDLRPIGMEIKKGKAGEGIRIRAEFDKNRYRLEESRESNGEDGFVYRVQLRASQTGFLASLGRLFFSSGPTVEVSLPPDEPLALDLILGQGGAMIDLGGLWLTDVSIDFQDGGMHVRFSETTKVPLESLSVRTRRGGLDLDTVGNASPRRLTVDAGMAGTVVNLRGAWQNDAEVEIDLSMGGTQVLLPKNTGITGLRTPFEHLNHAPETDVALPTLSFEYHADKGDISFE